MTFLKKLALLCCVAPIPSIAQGGYLNPNELKSLHRAVNTPLSPLPPGLKPPYYLTSQDLITVIKNPSQAKQLLDWNTYLHALIKIKNHLLMEGKTREMVTFVPLFQTLDKHLAYFDEKKGYGDSDLQWASVVGFPLTSHIHAPMTHYKSYLGIAQSSEVALEMAMTMCRNDNYFCFSGASSQEGFSLGDTEEDASDENTGESNPLFIPGVFVTKSTFNEIFDQIDKVAQYISTMSIEGYTFENVEITSVKFNIFGVPVPKNAAPANPDEPCQLSFYYQTPAP